MATIIRPPIKYSVASALVTVLAVTAQSYGTSLTLESSGQQPFFNPPFFSPVQHGINEFLNADTSRGTPNSLTQPPAFPAGQQSLISTQRYFQSADTTRGTPNTLTQPVIFPPGQQILGGSQFSFNVTNTSLSTPATLTQPVVFPVGQASFVALQNFFNVADTSQSTPAAYFPPPAPIPPGQASFVGTPTNIYLPADTSQIAWANYIPPFVPPPQPAVISGGAYPDDSDRRHKKKRDRFIRLPDGEIVLVKTEEGLAPAEFAKRYIAAQKREKAKIDGIAAEDEDIRGALLWMIMHDNEDNG